MAEIAYKIPVAPEYAKAIGHALYSFCHLEWTVVSIISCLQPDYIHDIQGFPAGKFASDLINRVEAEASLDTGLRACLRAFAADFKELVNRRNSLVHGNPFTAPSGEQRLGYSAKNNARVEWVVSDIVKLTRDFEKASAEASALLQGYLRGKL